MYKDDDLFVPRDGSMRNDELLRQLLSDRDTANDGDSGCCEGGGDKSCGRELSARRCLGVAEPRAEDNDCHSWGLEGYPVAMVYSPVQSWRNIYDNDTALVRGTIFEELDLPFVGGKAWNGARGGNCVTQERLSRGKCGGGEND